MLTIQNWLNSEKWAIYCTRMQPGDWRERVNKARGGKSTSLHEDSKIYK